MNDKTERTLVELISHKGPWPADKTRPAVQDKAARATPHVAGPSTQFDYVPGQSEATVNAVLGK